MRAILSKNYFVVRYEKIKNIMGIRGRKYAIIERWKILKLGLRHDLKGWRNRGGAGEGLTLPPPPDFVRPVNPISTRGVQFMLSHFYSLPLPQIFSHDATPDLPLPNWGCAVTPHVEGN